MKEYLGDFEQLVILALLRLGEEAYGMTVRREIEQRTGRTIAIGAVYSTLDRLEAKGMVQSHSGEATLERGGRAKRIFAATASGVAALQVSRDAMESMSEGLDLRGVAWKAN